MPCHKSEGKWLPDKVEGRCQCTMCHSGCYLDNTIAQCRADKAPKSNQFCSKCENLHGKEYRAKYGGTQNG